MQRFKMESSKAVSTPLTTHFKLSSNQSPSSKDEVFDIKHVPYAYAMGSLMYAIVCTRPDITQFFGTISIFLLNPLRKPWHVAKWILRYLRSTTSARLYFDGDTDYWNFTLGYMIKFTGGDVAWQSKSQKCVALSTIDVEFIAIAKACKELLWLKKFLQELGFVQDKYMLFVDS